MMAEKPIVVIGAGMAGMSAAIRLAARGRRVLILEQNPQVGGKMGEYRHGGFRWDTGPSLITMRGVFDELFQSSGSRLEDYLELQPVEPITRCIYPDGVVLDVSRELPRMAEQLRWLGEREFEGYLRFLSDSARLYRLTSPVFIHDQPPRWSSLLRVSPRDALRFDGLRTMDTAIRTYVKSPHLRQLLGMFATYVGASPYRAPATLNVIAHVELNDGVWYPRGGVYCIAQAYRRLAEDLGVELQLGRRVKVIDVVAGRAASVTLEDGEKITASAVIANLDVLSVYEQLLPGEARIQRRMRSLQQMEPSCSAFVMLLGVRGEHADLAHHNEFFSSNYPAEFRQIFEEGLPPSEPTIYTSITSKTTPEDAPPGAENWFIQINVPAAGPGWDWRERSEAYAEHALDLLAKRGVDLRSSIEVCKLFTPLDLERLNGARRGALYGASSNSRWAAFRRPHNRCAEVGGLYFAGGTTHPGGGAPMATLSGKVAAEMVIHDGF